MAVSLDLVTVKQTLADFRAQVAAPYSVFLAGSASPSDGYEGLYTYVASDTTSSDDGFAIIVDANNHRYYRDWLSGRNSSVATAQSVGISNADTIYVATTAVTFTIDRTTTLNVGWDVWIFAEGGIATISINVNDAINGGSAGTGATIPLGWSGHLSTDANGNIYLRTIPAIIGVGTIAAASTTDLSTIGPEVLSITGNTGITALGTVAVGVKKWVYFTGTPTITHNATSLILPNAGSNIIVAAGDIACFVSLGSGNWKCLEYQKLDGTSLQGAADGSITTAKLANNAVNYSKVATGFIIQEVSAALTSSLTTTATIPLDNTVPQNTEGTQILTCSITPLVSSSNLEITVSGVWDHSSTDYRIAALFRDSTASAICSALDRANYGTTLTTVKFTKVVAASSTSATTFAIRVGTVSGTLYINRYATGDLFNGTINWTIVIREIKA